MVSLTSVSLCTTTTLTTPSPSTLLLILLLGQEDGHSDKDAHHIHVQLGRISRHIPDPSLHLPEHQLGIVDDVGGEEEEAEEEFRCGHELRPQEDLGQ